MSPASYQTAPPRTTMLAARLWDQQPAARGCSARRRGGRRGGRAPGLVGERRRLLDQLSGLVDLRLVRSQVLVLQGLLRLLEVVQRFLQELGHVPGRRRRSTTADRRRHDLSERRRDG